VSWQTRGAVCALLAVSMLAGCPDRGSIEAVNPAPVSSRPPDRTALDGDSAPPTLAVHIDGIALPIDGQSLWLCADGRVHRWTWATASMTGVDAECARGMRVSADGTTIVTTSERALWVHRVHDDPTRRIELGLASDDHILDVAISVRGRHAAVATDAGAVKTVDLESGRVRQLEVTARQGSSRSSADDSTFGRLDIDRQVAVPRLGWSGDETTLALVAPVREIEAERVRGRVFIWNVDDASYRASDPFDVLDRRARGHLAIAASPTAHRLAVGSADGAVRLFDRHQLVWTSPAATAYPTALAFSTDADRFAVAYADGAVRIFGPMGTTDAIELWPEAGDAVSMAFTAGGDKLVLSVHEGPVAIIDTRTGEILARLAVLDRGWVAVSASGTVDGDQAGLDALAHGPIADVLGWEAGQRPSPHRAAGLLGTLLELSSLD
jgi:WD40 repeat protein